MSINHRGELVSAYMDTCTNYLPDKHKETGVRSEKSGVLYECKNYDHGDNVDFGCGYCVNIDCVGLPTRTKNMNETKGLPKDIDLLISVARSVILSHRNENTGMERRINALESILNRVEPEYHEIMGDKS